MNALFTKIPFAIFRAPITIWRKDDSPIFRDAVSAAGRQSCLLPLRQRSLAANQTNRNTYWDLWPPSANTLEFASYRGMKTRNSLNAWNAEKSSIQKSFGIWQLKKPSKPKRRMQIPENAA
jgi:hypothetical protein